MRDVIEAEGVSRPAPVPREDSRSSALLWIVAAWALGSAIQSGNGTGNPTSFPLLALAFLTVLVGVATPRIRLVERFGDRAATALIAIALVHQFAALASVPPGMYLRISSAAIYAQFLSTLAVCAVLAGASMLDRSSWGAPFAFVALLGAHFVLGLWILKVSPAPHIDVWAWHNETFRLLNAGMNPYSATMPDIYGNPAFYAPGLVVNGRVQTGYPYPPLTLGLELLGKYFGGDYRYAHLAALTATGGLLGFARKTPLAFGAAALFLFTPRWLFVLEQGWTDVYPAFLLAVVVFVAARLPRGTAWALGFWLAVKQYLVIALPLAPLLLRPRTPRDLVRPLLIALGVVAVLIIPFALFDLRGFWSSLVGLQAKQPFRPDSLSFLAWWKGRGGDPVLWLGFLLLPAVYALAWWRAPRTESGFAGAVALVYLCFFAFGKQAFANYYFFIIGALCAAVALGGAPASPAPVPAVAGEEPVQPERSRGPAA